MDNYYLGEPLRIGNAPQLLIDDTIIEDRWRLQRVMHQPIRSPRNPVIMADKPWESGHVQGPKVIWDEELGRYRMWYSCFSMSNYYHGSGPVEYTGYAESDDGFNWEKPLFDRFPIDKYKRTNIVHMGIWDQGTYYGNNDPEALVTRVQIAGLSQLFKDVNDPDPNRRYKMISTEGRPRDDLREVHCGVQLLTSPDGFNWTLDGEKPLLDSASDCLNHLVWDERNQQWLLICRPPIWHSGRHHGPRNIRRRVAAMTSKDLQNWTYPRVVCYPDEYDTTDYDHVYVQPYGDNFMMLYGAMDGDLRAGWELKLATSQDGFHWNRYHTREVYFGLGPAGAWDGGGVLPSCAFVPHSDHLLLYYSGFNLGQEEQGDFTSGIGVAKIKIDRFVEQRARDVTGYLLTKEFILEGKTLRINCEEEKTTRRESRLRVEILRHPPHGEHWQFQQAYDGFSLEDCDPLAIDHTDAVVSWKGKKDLSSLAGKPVYLRFEMENTGIFSFRIAPD